ncbi:MAG: class I SAM-dependent methyltransferase [Sediminibacterium sp.]|nr:class I SAM-dependent methyltransferase [Sediminibacterium sp.]
MIQEQEKNNLEKIAHNSLYTTLSNQATIEHSYNVFKPYLLNGKILELGPAEGLMTELLLTHTNELTVVDGSSQFCSTLSSKFPQIIVINELFENFSTNIKFDNIVLGHVLEHVENPILILERVKEFLKPNGRIFAAVPNAHSLHRQAAVLMGLIKSESEMSELDFHHGHRRIYNPFSFRSDFIQAGFNIYHYGGYWLKPVSNQQIHASWNIQMLQAFMKLGERYPDIAAEIFIIADNIE